MFCARPSWSEIPWLATQRQNAAAVVLVDKRGDQQLLVTGGSVTGVKLSSVELLNLRSQKRLKWTTIAPMRQTRYLHRISYFRGRVVVGGAEGNSVELFSNPAADGDLGQRTQLQPLLQLRGPVCLTVLRAA